MTLFITKVWGLSIPIGPLQFSSSGWRENALQRLKPGDQVALVATMGKETQKSLRGRILGVMEPTREPVMSLDFRLPTSPSHFIDGAYKWPIGLMNYRAWSLPEAPLLSDVSERNFNMDSAQGIVPLTSKEEQLLRAYHWREEQLLAPTAQAQQRLARRLGVPKRSAPPPTTHRTGIMHMRRAPAYTYAMRIEGAQEVSFKIGWAFDAGQRERQFNHASMPDLGGLKYKLVWTELWDTARLAYGMEQRLLEHFATHRNDANTEIIVGITPRQLELAWQNGVMGRL